MMLLACASSKDLKKVQAEFGRKNNVLEEKAVLQEKEIQSLKAENLTLTEAVTALRQSQAEKGADLTDLKEQLQQIRGQLDQLDMFRKDTTLSKEKMDALTFKIGFIENYLGIGKKDKEDAPDSSDRAKAGNGKGKSDKESAYAAAYNSFKEGKYEKARGDFQTFLKQYPATELSGNAQFWIGECYYYDGKYEKAIVEYEKVVKHYSVSDKVPYALLKQGLSFQKLGDKASARILLQQVIRQYPNTNQAALARTKLLELK